MGFFSRKGFYALNVQCMVNREKKVLWAKCNNRGSSHDSSCFRDSYLYEILKCKSEELINKRQFILGDSAYAIESFMIPPYDQAGKDSPEDNQEYVWTTGEEEELDRLTSQAININDTELGRQTRKVFNKIISILL